MFNKPTTVLSQYHLFEVSFPVVNNTKKCFIKTAPAPLSCQDNSLERNTKKGFCSQRAKVTNLFGIPYFIEYTAHTSIVCTWISQWFLVKKLILFFTNNFTRINHCKFIHHKSHLKPFLSYLPCILHREYFSIIFNVKKCTLYLIKYGNLSQFRRQIFFFCSLKRTSLARFWPV